MKTYPPYVKRPVLEFIPSEERRAVSKRFHALFGPVLKENGFVRTGTSWFRIHGHQLLQGIDFNLRPNAKYVNDMPVMFVVQPLYHHPRFGTHPGSFLYYQQYATQYVYPGSPTNPYHFFSGIYDENGNRRKEMLLEVWPPYCTFFDALRDTEEALQAEFELFCERTLPVFNRMADRAYYMEWLYNTMFPKRIDTFCNQPGIERLIYEGDWDSAIFCVDQSIDPKSPHGG